MSASDIQSNSQDPRRASVDGQSAEQHPIKDQIEAQRFEDAESAKSSKKPGLRLFQFRNRGTVSP